MKVVIDDYRLEKMDTYTEPLEAKIRRQAAEITRLLAENENLKAENGNVIWEIEQAFDRGCNAAWKLAQKIARFELDGGYSIDELKAIFDNPYMNDIFDLSYPEAAAKVEAWERKKEEICVGDVVRFKSNNRVEFCVTDILDNSFLYGINAEGDVYSDRDIKLFEKTGRHIDVASMLAQIGGDCNG